MSKPAVEIVNLGEQAIWGIGRQSGDQTISADIHALSAAYHSLASVPRGSVLPFLFCPETMMAGMVPLNYLWAAHLKKTGWSRRFFPPGNMPE